MRCRAAGASVLRIGRGLRFASRGHSGGPPDVYCDLGENMVYLFLAYYLPAPAETGVVY